MQQNISIIMPTYNRAHCIGRAIESVLKQTWKNWELIIVDDGSTDNTTFIVEKYKQQIGPQLYYYKKVNEGVSKARNIAIKRSRGGLIAFLDSDDYYYPHKLERQVQALDNNPDAVMCYTNWSTFYDDENDGSYLHPLPEKLQGYIYPELISVQNCFITTPSVLIKRDTLFAAGLFDINMNICEDIDLWRRVSRIGSITQIYEPLIGVHLRQEESFNYVESVSARMTLYKNAIRDDPALPFSMLKVMMADVYKAYIDVAQHREDFIYINFLENARLEALSANKWEDLETTSKTFSTQLKENGHR